MSLIDLRNFTAPLKNKVAVGAIIVVCVVVAVARITGSSGARSSGGGREEYGDEQSKRTARYLAQQEEELNANLGNSQAGRKQESVRIEDEYLSGLLEEELAPKAPKAPSKSENDNKLSEIKKSLGLE